MNNSQTAYERLKNIIFLIKDDGKINSEYIEEFQKALEDDINTPKALQVLWGLVRDNKADGKYRTIQKMDEIFGLDLLKREKVHVPEEVRDIVEEREKARKMKDWKKADILREKITKFGFQVNDTPDGWEIKKI